MALLSGVRSFEMDHQRAQAVACSFYVNACFPPVEAKSDEQHRQLPVENLRVAIHRIIPDDRWYLVPTTYGLCIAFCNFADANVVFQKVDMAKELDGPVQVACLPFGMPKYNYQASLNRPTTQLLIVRDVPWSIPLEELKSVLDMQHVHAASIERWRQNVKIEVSDPYENGYLLAEGLDFYSVCRFSVVPERISGNYEHQHGPGPDDDVLQCYRCQGFWHLAANCRHLPRCVRCGDSHCVEFCGRPRNNPLCCNCSGSHHAGYKFCPVRQQMSHSVPVYFTLSVNRPLNAASPITPNTSDERPRCLL